jgi:hypothetical protein
MNAGFREIKRPGDEKKSDIDSFLNLTSEIGGTFSQISSEMVSYQLNTTNVAAMTQITTLLADTSQKKLPDWSVTAQRLGLTQCPDFRTLATQSPVDDGRSERAHRRPGGPHEAGGRPVPDQLQEPDAGVSVRDHRGTVVPGGAEWAEPSGQRDSVFRSPIPQHVVVGLVGGLSFVDCGEGRTPPEAGTRARWSRVAWPADRAPTSTNYIFMWTFDDDLIGILADGPSREVMFQWWLANAFLIMPRTS